MVPGSRHQPPYGPQAAYSGYYDGRGYPVQDGRQIAADGYGRPRQPPYEYQHHQPPGPPTMYNNAYGSTGAPRLGTSPRRNYNQQYSHSPAYPSPQAGAPARRTDNAAQPVSVTPEQIRAKLEKVLADKNAFIRSAKASFEQFDQDRSGTLDFRETRSLLSRLCQNLQLPPVEPSTLQQIFAKYDTDDSGSLDLEEFAQMYWRLLLTVREKYYPSKKFRVRRNVFVGRFPLANAGGIRKIFDFQKKIGAGSFGEVHLVKELRSGFTRVCKTINKDQAAVPVEQIEAEINILKQLDHPNIIKIYDVYEDYNSVYIIMEYCKGGELLDRIVQAQQRAKALTEKYVMGIMQQILLALSYFHSQKIAHKDLKPENVLFQDTSPTSPIKVIDFGLAEIFRKTDEYSHNAAGTVLYMAPEVFQRRLDLKCDVWSAGVLMYLLLTGHLPYSGKSVSEIKNKVLRDEPLWDVQCRYVSETGIDLLKKMLQKQPRQRLSASEALQHPWFQSENLGKVVLPPSICENMKRYMKQAGLKNVLINLMAHQLDFTGGQVKLISDVFNKLDKDQNGLLSASELTLGLRNAGLQPWEITKIIQALDIDGSGSISYTEFLAACYTWRESELNIVWTAFNKLDTDADGVISVEEFSRLLLGGGDVDQDLTQSRLIKRREGNREQLEEDVRKLVQEIDRNGDGKIDWDEFIDYMRGTTSR
eukprot:Blabericola_migrator_1__3657@NODE_2096_length_3280_cov_158_697790_g1327_i0_p1_GENE_NODE_2096_length_3280_cov_158_697790_g1327_i0NODE_2096_length_3280_cov_158_697790_g1327_i0_p1_ORF_typecomplete_len702_score114_12Pkinase/PF00069_25/1_1e71Pkinase_Tyr/PF07714_17/3e50EFhand_7/PF13499_6/3_8e11EFhand_7/PF13499_6/5_7e13EFhand_7/PF13499_6/1_1e14EFhand_8/PF13833_6/0_018EFhand_8/PF13833_6/1_6e05EFhand_8/PF13833_6/5_3EFhand_8/PF13833_6/8_1e05EFhand_8/PF13833_6/0_0029EFhand_8/PF13833_6/2_3e07EFhand_1/PF0003